MAIIMISTFLIFPFLELRGLKKSKSYLEFVMYIVLYVLAAAIFFLLFDRVS